MRDGLNFGGYLPPPSVPADPLDEDWRGQPGPPGPQGPPGPPGGTAGGDLTGPLNFIATGASAMRSAQDRAKEAPYSVMDFGAVMNGTTSDNAALTAAFQATPAFGTIRIPAGNINPGGFSPTSKMLLWKLDGTYTGSGTTPFSGIGNTVIESFLPNGTKFFARASTTSSTAIGPVLRADLTVSHAAGAAGTVSAFTANLASTAGYTGNMGLIGAAVNVTNARTSGGAEATGIMATTIRPAGGSGAAIFGANIIADDRTLENSSQSGSAVSVELNTKANGLDDGLAADGYNIPGSASGANLGASRVLLDLKYGRSVRGGAGDAPAEWSNIFNIGIVDTDTSWNSAKNYIRLTGKATFSAINTIHLDLTAGAHVLAMDAEQTIAWTTASPAAVPTAASWRALQYRAATGKLYYVVGGVDKFSIDASGNVRAAGTVTGSVAP